MMMPPDSPDELSGFPQVAARGPYYKVHLADTEPANFGNSGLYHFDPPPHRQDDFGTCYMATSREGALLEILGGIRPLSQRHLDARVVTDMVVPGGLRIADLTEDREAWLWNADEAWRGAWGGMLGLDGYPITQRWAEVLHDAGFHGVQYKPNHNPHRPTYSVVALWSEPGVQHHVVKSEGSERLTNLSLTWLLQWTEILTEEDLADGDSMSERESEDESGDEPDNDSQSKS